MNTVNPISFNANDCAPQRIAQPSALHTPPQLRALPASKLKHTRQDVQAARRNTCPVQPECFSRTLPSTERSPAAEGSKPTVRLPDANPVHPIRNGGQKESARSHNWKPHRNKVYDPNLGRHSVPVVEDPHLMERIVDDSNFIRALEKINQEPNKACGCDHKGVREVCSHLLESQEAREKVRKALLNGTYQVNRVLSRQIPKSNGKMRTLGIATVMDRIVETMIYMAVEDSLPENPWSPYSFAYLPKRGTKDAINEVNHIREEGYKFGICLDLKAFFDNVPHDRLIRKLREHVKDKRVVRLVIAFLTPVVIGDRTGSLAVNRIGTPQGSVISPWLASKLYLDELDKELTLRQHRFVRYADDVTVFCRTKPAAKRVMAKLIGFIEGTMKCPVNREKTKIVEIERISLLGVELKNGKWQILRKKVVEKCAQFWHQLSLYQQTRDVYYLCMAEAVMRGFVEAYDKIPGINRNRINSLKRWSRRKWSSALQGVETEVTKRTRSFSKWCTV